MKTRDRSRSLFFCHTQLERTSLMQGKLEIRDSYCAVRFILFNEYVFLNRVANHYKEIVMIIVKKRYSLHSTTCNTSSMEHVSWCFMRKSSVSACIVCIVKCEIVYT